MSWSAFSSCCVAVVAPGVKLGVVIRRGLRSTWRRKRRNPEKKGLELGKRDNEEGDEEETGEIAEANVLLSIFFLSSFLFPLLLEIFVF